MRKCYVSTVQEVCKYLQIIMHITSFIKTTYCAQYIWTINWWTLVWSSDRGVLLWLQEATLLVKWQCVFRGFNGRVFIRTLQSVLTYISVFTKIEEAPICILAWIRPANLQREHARAPVPNVMECSRLLAVQPASTEYSVTQLLATTPPTPHAHAEHAE